MIQVIQKLFQKYFDFFIFGVSNIFILATNLIVVKILNSRFGLETTGQVSIVFISMMLINSFIDFGFNITSTQKVIEANGDKGKISIIFYNTIKIKFLLFFLSLTFIPILLKLYPSINLKTVIIALTIPLSQSFSLLWYYQAIKKIKFYSYFVILTKLLYLVTIFQLTSSFLFNFYFGLYNIILNIIAYLYLIQSEKIISKFFYSTKINFKQEIIENIGVFSSNILIFLFLNTGFFLFSMIGNPVQIGIYSVAEKFLNSGRQFLAVYFNYSIPRMFESFQLHGAKGITFFRKQYFSLLIGLSILLIIIFILKSKISILFLNEENLDFQKLLLIFSLILIAVAINIPFFMYLLFSNKKKMYNFILLIGLIILIIMCFYTAVRYKSLGIAFSILISEIIVSSLLIYSANQKSNIIHYLIKAKS